MCPLDSLNISLRSKCSWSQAYWWATHHCCFI